MLISDLTRVHFKRYLHVDIHMASNEAARAVIWYARPRKK